MQALQLLVCQRIGLGKDQQRRKNAGGEASFPGIDPGRYHVTATVAAFVPVSVDKDVDTGVNVRLTVKLVAI